MRNKKRGMSANLTLLSVNKIDNYLTIIIIIIIDTPQYAITAYT